MASEKPDHDLDVELTRLVDGFIERIRREPGLTIDAYAAEYPDYAEILRRELTDETNWSRGGRAIRDKLKAESSEERLTTRLESLGFTKHGVVPESVSDQVEKSSLALTLDKHPGDQTWPARLMEAVRSLVDPDFAARHNTTEQILKVMKLGIETAFAVPTPRLDAIFGDKKSDIISPFGKVRYPIEFSRAEPALGLRSEVTIEDTSIVHRTAEHAFALSQQSAPLEEGGEYVWTWRLFDGDNLIDETSGFFTLATDEEMELLTEFESRVSRIGFTEDRRFLRGLYLESVGFLIEAARQYEDCYAVRKAPAFAYRIACCYNELGLTALREKWNRRIVDAKGGPN